MSPPAGIQHAALALRVGDRAVLSVDVAVTSRGLLAIGGLVSSILVSTALIVHVARRPVSAAPGTAPRTRA